MNQFPSCDTTQASIVIDVMGTKRYRYVLSLRDDQGMSYAEIGERLGITPLAARLRVHFARKKFGIEVPPTNSRANRRSENKTDDLDGN